MSEIAKLEEKRRQLEEQKRLLAQRKEELARKALEASMTDEQKILIQKEKARRERIEAEKAAKLQKKESTSGVDGLKVEQDFITKKMPSQNYRKYYENKIYEYVTIPGLIRGCALTDAHRRSILKYVPSIDLSQVVVFHDESKLFKPNWTVVTTSEIIESTGLVFKLNNIKMARSGKYGEVDVYDLKNQIKSVKFRMPDTQMASIINAWTDAYIDLEAYGWKLDAMKRYEEAFQCFLESAIFNGNIDSCNSLGIYYVKGKYVRPDENRAIYWYEKGAENGHYYSASNLMTIYRTRKQYDKAWYWAEKGLQLDGKNKDSILISMGDMARYGYGCPRDTKLAKEYYLKSYELGNSRAAYLLGEMNIQYPSDDAAALKYYLDAVERNYDFAKISLGDAYHYGRGVPKNDEIAYNWYMQAKEKNYPKVYLSLGKYHLDRKEYDEAEQYFLTAVQKGMRSAYTQLGDLYCNEQFHKYNIDEGLYWYEKGADENIISSLNRLAKMTYQGIGVVQDAQKAAALYQKAIDYGSYDARGELSQMYLCGAGVKKDKAKAFHLMEEALRSNNLHSLLIQIQSQRNDLDGEELLKKLYTVCECRGESESIEAKRYLMDYIIQNMAILDEEAQSRVITYFNELVEEDEHVLDYADELGTMISGYDIPIFNEEKINQSKQQVKAVSKLPEEKKIQEMMGIYLSNPCLFQVNAYLGKYFYEKGNHELALGLYRHAILAEDAVFDAETVFNEAYLSFMLEGNAEKGKEMVYAISQGYSQGKQRFVEAVLEYPRLAYGYEHAETAIEYAESLWKKDDPRKIELRNLLRRSQLESDYQEAKKIREKILADYNRFKIRFPEAYAQIADLRENYHKSLSCYLIAAARGHSQAIHELLDADSSALRYIRINTQAWLYSKLNESSTPEGKLKLSKMYLKAKEVEKALQTLRDLIVSLKDEQMKSAALEVAKQCLKEAEKSVILDDVYRELLRKEFAFDNDLETIRLTCKIAERWTKNKKRKVEVPIWFASYASLNERKEVFIEGLKDLEKTATVMMYGDEPFNMLDIHAYPSSEYYYTRRIRPAYLVVESDEMPEAFAATIFANLYLMTIGKNEDDFWRVGTIPAICEYVNHETFVFENAETSELFEWCPSDPFMKPIGIKAGQKVAFMTFNDQIICAIAPNQINTNLTHLMKQVHNELMKYESEIKLDNGFDTVKTLYSEKKFKTLLPQLNTLVKQENAEAIYLLGKMTQHGQGVHKDNKQAMVLFEQAYELGVNEASFDIGDLLYDTGQYEDAYFAYFREQDKANSRICHLVLKMVEQKQLNLNDEDTMMWKCLLLNQGSRLYEDEIHEAYRLNKLGDLSPLVFSYHLERARKYELSSMTFVAQSYGKGIGTELNKSCQKYWENKMLLMIPDSISVEEGTYAQLYEQGVLKQKPESNISKEIMKYLVEGNYYAEEKLRVKVNTKKIELSKIHEVINSFKFQTLWKDKYAMAYLAFDDQQIELEKALKTCDFIEGTEITVRVCSKVADEQLSKLLDKLKNIYSAE